MSNVITGIQRALPEGLGGALFISLHRHDPDRQDQYEADFIGYRRMPVPRTQNWWGVEGNRVTLLQDVMWPACQRGSAEVRFAAVGIQETGRGPVLYSFQVRPAVTVLPGVTFLMRRGSEILDLAGEVENAIKQANMLEVMDSHLKKRRR